MARIFITGSADGLGFLAAKSLVSNGHSVILHARNEERKSEALHKLPEAETALIGDLASIEETMNLANQVNDLGRFDAVIHNAGVYRVPSNITFLVNTLAPFILTCLVQKPKRLIYLSSGMHRHGNPNLENFSLGTTGISYSDTKLHVVMLSMAIARKWKDIYSNAVDPGWVPTKMGGHGAPDDLDQGYETQTWLATSDDDKAKVSGRYFFHQKERAYNPTANDVALQEKFIKTCEEITGVHFPR